MTTHIGERYKELYVVVKNILPTEVIKISEQYSLFKMLNEFTIETDEHTLVPNTHSVYGDSLMETLLLYTKPKIEEIIKRKLIPTYSYYRVYKPGDTLEEHMDRESCELSASITLGYKYNNTDDNYKWPLFVRAGDEKRYLDTEPGDAVIYRGGHLAHGRDRFEAGEYSYHIQVFLHYIFEDGPYVEQYAYDGRTGIGCKKNKK